MSQSLVIKICGITRAEDAQTACDAGADYYGMVYQFPVSKRSLTFPQVEEIVGKVDGQFILVTVNLDPNRTFEADNAFQPLAVQLHGDESPDHIRDLKAALRCQIWKVIHVEAGILSDDATNRIKEDAEQLQDAGCDALMIDTSIPYAVDERRYGGTGLTADWKSIRSIADSLRVPFILTGGLRPENVRSAIEIVCPFGVDVSSGVETSPGIKDPDRIRSFVSEARSADTSHTAH